MKQTVIHFTDSTAFGGAEQALVHLLAGLDRTRWRPVLFHHPAPGLTPLVQAAQTLDIERCVLPLMPLGWLGAQRIPGFIKVLRTWQPAVFHAHLTWPLACKYGLVGALLARTPATVATAQLFFELPYSWATRLQQRLLATRLGRYIAVSHALACRLQQVFAIPVGKIQVIHNAIPTEQFAQPPNTRLRQSWQGDQQRPIILTVARLDPQKGHRFLLEAATRIPEAAFVWVGEGPEREALQTQARVLGVAERVHFLGQRPDIPDLLASCDLFVLPSLFEGLPLAVLEAMAAGKPVITSAIPGTSEAVTHEETGLLTPPGDGVALAAAIRRLLAQPALGQRLAATAQMRVRQDFSVRTMVQQVEQVYECLLQSKRGKL